MTDENPRLDTESGCGCHNCTQAFRQDWALDVIAETEAGLGITLSTQERAEHLQGHVDARDYDVIGPNSARHLVEHAERRALRTARIEAAAVRDDAAKRLHLAMEAVAVAREAERAWKSRRLG